MTNGERAGIVALAARTEEGISCLMVEKEPGPTTGGITVSRNIGKLGYKGIETVEMVRRDDELQSVRRLHAVHRVQDFMQRRRAPLFARARALRNADHSSRIPVRDQLQ